MSKITVRSRKKVLNFEVINLKQPNTAWLFAYMMNYKSRPTTFQVKIPSDW